MEQLFLIIQQIYELLDLLNSYSQDEREELVKGYQRFFFEVNDLLKVLDSIVEGRTPWGWKIEWGSQIWQLRTFRQQVGLILQAGWEDKIDFGLDLYRDIPVVSPKTLVSKNRFQVLSPVDLSALRGETDKPEVVTDTCKVCHLQHERPVVFHEQISNNSSSSSSTGDNNETNELSIGKEDV